MISGFHSSLQRIAEKLSSVFPETSIRGGNAASFVFVRAGDRSVEISFLDEQHIWVEFWDHVLGEDAPPAREQTYEESNILLGEVRQWLNKVIQ